MTVYDLIDATWPAAGMQVVGPWTVREGSGGGSRVSAATTRSRVRADEWLEAQQAMLDLGQSPLVMIRPGDAVPDAELAITGFAIKDPVTVYSAPVAGCDPGQSWGECPLHFPWDGRCGTVSLPHPALI